MSFKKGQTVYLVGNSWQFSHSTVIEKFKFVEETDEFIVLRDFVEIPEIVVSEYGMQLDHDYIAVDGVNYGLHKFKPEARENLAADKDEILQMHVRNQKAGQEALEGNNEAFHTGIDAFLEDESQTNFLRNYISLKDEQAAG